MNNKKISFVQKINSWRTGKTQAYILRYAVKAAAAVSIAIPLVIVIYILFKGIPHISLDLFSPEYNTDNVSLFPAMVNTLIIIALALLMAVPVGLFSAIYLVEYAGKGNKAVKLIRTTTETLSGIPSIVYGLFGFLMFVIYFGWSYSVMAGAITLAIMILPVIMRTSEEALKAIPDSFREGSFGLGAGKLRTVFRIVLPSAMQGIFAGIILSVGRIIGETAALIYTAGTVADIPNNLFSSGRTLSVHMYMLWKEGLQSDKAYATAVILLIVVVCINALASYASKKLGKGNVNG